MALTQETLEMCPLSPFTIHLSQVLIDSNSLFYKLTALALASFSFQLNYDNACFQQKQSPRCDFSDPKPRSKPLLPFNEHRSLSFLENLRKNVEQPQLPNQAQFYSPPSCNSSNSYSKFNDKSPISERYLIKHSMGECKEANLTT